MNVSFGFFNLFTASRKRVNIAIVKHHAGGRFWGPRLLSFHPIRLLTCSQIKAPGLSGMGQDMGPWPSRQDMSCITGRFVAGAASLALLESLVDSWPMLSLCRSSGLRMFGATTTTTTTNYYYYYYYYYYYQ